MTWRVRNVINELNDGRHRERNLDALKYIAIHRVGLDKKLGLSLGKNGFEVAKQFIHNPDVAKYTGGENPYTFIVDPDGTIWQCLPIDEVGNHARRWNVPALGVAFYGDFRTDSPTEAQFTRGMDLCFVLVHALGLTPWDIKGHTELPGGSQSPDKSCPGPKFDLDFFRTEMASAGTGWEPYRDEEDRRRRVAAERGLLWDHGIVWDGI